jgi:SSS family solute:Na+ symporter
LTIENQTARGEIMITELAPTHIISFVITLLTVTAVGLYSGRRVKTSKDFMSGGRKSGSLLIGGAIMGTLVGGASTIGTAQVAFEYGLSAWWFTLGSGIACLFLGLFLASPMRRLDADTIPAILGSMYGPAARIYSALFSSVATFISLVAQVLSAIALITALSPMNNMTAAIITIALISTYVFFGGIWGTGMVGLVKLVLLSTAMIFSGILAVELLGAPWVIMGAFPKDPWLNLLGRGPKADLGSAFSMLVGVVSTQTYMQVMFSAKNTASARKGALISAFLIPPIGAAGVLVGLFMRIKHPTIESANALPLFVMEYLPPWMAGTVYAILVITIVAAGAGLCLGVSTLIKADVLSHFVKEMDDKRSLLLHRIITLITVCLTILFVNDSLMGIIMKWSFLSMGIRGATIFFPLLGVLFLKGRISPKAGNAAIFISPLIVLIWPLIFPNGLDPLFPGLACGMAITLLSLVIRL